MKKVLILTLVTLILDSCAKKAETQREQAGNFPDMEAMAEMIMARSNLQPGERVVLVSRPGDFDSLIVLLANKIQKSEAEYLGAFSVDSLVNPLPWQTDFVKAASGKNREALTYHLMTVDLGIMLPGASPTDKPYAAMQDVLKKNKGRTIHFHWSGAYDLTGNPIRVDTAMGTLYQKALLETDYATLAQTQRKFETSMRSEWVNVTTPLGTNLKFKIGSRPVTKQDGDASSKREQQRNLIDREIELPAGAIRVAPEEESVEGVIGFPDGVWSNQKVEGLVLTIKSGKVTDIKAKQGADAVKAELDAVGDAGYSFREFALGFNPLLAIPTEGKPCIPYYGYGAGVVRLSLGDNSELGGNVRGNYVRWNFFTDATVLVGQEVWVREGKFLKGMNN